ncbi:hypothetical protein [Variovorax sp. V15]|uniref:hypothetical protein n=1 Tax=Variovorax sp. V15 TaxID=3065952 RepID=UPI0034E8AC04
MSWESTINEFRRVDAQREDYPGEHLVVLGVGVLLLLAAGRSRSLVARLAAGAAGGALIGRAASGTGGISKLTRQLQHTLEKQFNLGCPRDATGHGTDVK